MFTVRHGCEFNENLVFNKGVALYLAKPLAIAELVAALLKCSPLSPPTPPQTKAVPPASGPPAPLKRKKSF